MMVYDKSRSNLKMRIIQDYNLPSAITINYRYYI